MHGVLGTSWPPNPTSCVQFAGRVPNRSERRTLGRFIRDTTRVQFPPLRPACWCSPTVGDTGLRSPSVRVRFSPPAPRGCGGIAGTLVSEASVERREGASPSIRTNVALAQWQEASHSRCEQSGFESRGRHECHRSPTAGGNCLSNSAVRVRISPMTPEVSV